LEGGRGATYLETHLLRLTYLETICALHLNAFVVVKHSTRGSKLCEASLTTQGETQGETKSETQDETQGVTQDETQGETQGETQSEQATTSKFDVEVAKSLDPKAKSLWSSTQLAGGLDLRMVVMVVVVEIVVV
jgi:hypothetical protein